MMLNRPSHSDCFHHFGRVYHYKELLVKMKNLFFKANNADPFEMPNLASSHMGLRCLLMLCLHCKNRCKLTPKLVALELPLILL